MNKRLLITTIVLMLLAVGLSGCFGTDDTGTDNGWEYKVEIVIWYNGTYWEAGKLMANGFVYHEDAKFYLVNGTARNIAGKEIKSVIIYVKYYDRNNTFLLEDGLLENNIKHNQTWDFHSFYLRSFDHFEDVDHVEFDILGELVE